MPLTLGSALQSTAVDMAILLLDYAHFLNVWTIYIHRISHIQSFSPTAAQRDDLQLTLQYAITQVLQDTV